MAHAAFVVPLAFASIASGSTPPGSPGPGARARRVGFRMPVVRQLNRRLKDALELVLSPWAGNLSRLGWSERPRCCASEGHWYAGALGGNSAARECGLRG